MDKVLPFEYHYADLPSVFYQKISNTRFKNIQLLYWNSALGEELGISKKDWTEDELASIFSAKILMPGAKPLAQAYSGHQFGHFNPSLGDGRALLLGELRNKQNLLKDIHLKGSGPTSFSRSGDGLAQLGAVVRECLVSESMFALGIPSSRALALIATGETVARSNTDIQPGAILVRVASSHVRVGTFEYLVSRQDFKAAKILADFVLNRHYSEIRSEVSSEQSYNIYLELFRSIVQSQASLVARWMHVGFIHGVMNTDNTFVSGETLDYGPCAFMERYDPRTVLSFIDRQGRYAYMQQPRIMAWNLQVLGQCFLTWISNVFPKSQHNLQQQIEDILTVFETEFNNQYLRGMAHKLGFSDSSQPIADLLRDFLQILFEHKMDYTLSFRNLSSDEFLFSEVLPSQNSDMQQWRKQWLLMLQEYWRNRGEENYLQAAKQFIEKHNPIYIARNHLVEESIQSCLKNDWQPFDRLLSAVSDPFTESKDFIDLSLPAKPDQEVKATYCNT